MTSVNRGTQPRWRNDGNELYYIEGEAIMAVSVATESGFTLERPQRLFEDPSPTTVGNNRRDCGDRHILAAFFMRRIALQLRRLARRLLHPPLPHFRPAAE